MSRKKSAGSSAVLNPRRGCEFCHGTGWVQELVAPSKERDGQRVEYSPPMRRCSCTDPQKRSQEIAPEPAPAALDSAQKASGEKED